MSKQQIQHPRGAALVETAFVMTYLLGLLFGGVQLGLMGYYQLAMDQAAGAQSHLSSLSYANGLGQSSDAANLALQQNLPELSKGSLGQSKLESPIAINTQSVSYNFANQNARTGGFTFAMPMQQLSTLSMSLPFGLGQKITISSTAVEAATAEFCPHFCLVASGLTKATVAADAVNYFTQGDNTTPYYIGFHYMETCNSDPTMDFTSVAANTPWKVCPGQVLYRALGTAAHLDESNSMYQGKGEALDPNYPAFSKVPPSVNYVQSTGPFFETWCHRNYYVWLAANIFKLESIPAKVTAQSPYPTPPFYSPKTLFGYSGAAPNPGQVIYGSTGNSASGFTSGSADQTGTAGWDASQISQGADGELLFNTALSPWWGCGAQL